MCKNPKTFIQIHYHNRPGGVTSVMYRYADTFLSSSKNSPIHNCIICHQTRTGTQEDNPTNIVDVPACDYRRFTNRSQFDKAANELFLIIAQIIKNAPKPAIIIAHNLTIGKNCALSTAFARCAEVAYNADPLSTDVRFFVVIHDFAENCRTDMMQEIKTVESFEHTFRTDRYCPLPNIQYVTINKFSATILKKAQIKPRVLPNPLNDEKSITATGSPEVKTRCIDALSRFARLNNYCFDHSLPILYSPGRTIGRKNIAESLLIAMTAAPCNLLLGPDPTSSHDRTFALACKAFCAQQNLPVIFDAPHAHYLLKSTQVTNSEMVEMLLGYARAALTTAVSEGFGYVFYEPWFFGTPAVGRIPLGIDPPISDVSPDSFYKKLLIPLEWIDYRHLIDQTYDSFCRCFGLTVSKNGFESQFLKSHCTKESIDFGVVDKSQQLTVLAKCAQDNASKETIIHRNRVFFETLNGLLTTPIEFYADKIETTRNRLLVNFGTHRFLSNFEDVFLSERRTTRQPDSQQYEPQNILTHFADPAQFNIHLTP